jgi:hypothetical protein
MNRESVCGSLSVIILYVVFMVVMISIAQLEALVKVSDPAGGRQEQSGEVRATCRRPPSRFCSNGQAAPNAYCLGSICFALPQL